MRCARWVCGSTPPGTTTLPAASITRVASRNVPGAATAAILPSSTAISHAPAPCGVTTWPFRISRSRIAPAGSDGADRVHPRLQPRVGVIDGAQPKISPIGGGERGCGRGLVLDDGERSVARAQPLVHVVGEPRLVAELPRHPELRRHHIKDVTEAADVLLEVRWQLEKQGTQPDAEAPRDVAEDTYRLVDVTQARDVR